MSLAFWGINDDNGEVDEGTLQQLQDELVRIDPTLKGITVFPQNQPALKRSSSDFQQSQAVRSNQPQRSKSLPSSAGKS
uniref:Uncharacterized protein n=1 Tax=Larimichthys crocea TaxID=215358 RepID=A0A0F8BHY6_LARCR